MVGHHVVFQPIVRIEDWHVVGYEALARFDDGRSPLAHLADARATGTLVDLELELIRSAVTACRTLKSDALITMNSSAETLADARLPEVLSGRSHEWGIELSEMSAVSFYEGLRQTVRSLGVALLLDDAGARHSDIERVLNSNPSIVKVDKSVLQAAVDTVPDMAGLMMFCESAHSVNAIALAEGVETPAQAKLLQELGYELGQGYLYGYPALAEEWADR